MHTYAVTAGHCRNSASGYARGTRTGLTGTFVRTVVEPPRSGGADHGLIDFGINSLPSAFIGGHCQLEQSEGDFRRFASAIHQVACDL